MRNKFLTFCCAWFFGAGQMYQGYMKRGVTLMTMFMGTIFISVITLPQFLILCPIIYAYAFFDTFNIARMSPEEREQTPDTFLLGLDKIFAKLNLETLYDKRHKWVGWGVIGFGLILLFNNFVSPVLWQIYYSYEFEWLARIINNVPSLAVSAALLFFGFRILKGAPKNSQQEEIIEFSKGEK